MKVLLFITTILFINISFANQTLERLESIEEKKFSSVGMNNENAINQSLNTNFDNFNKNHALVLFYSSNCPHCRKFTPILRYYSANFKIKIAPITVDGVNLSEFPESLRASKKELTWFYQDNKMQITVPALFILNTQTLVSYPIAYGELTYFDLVNRINDLKRKIIDYEKNNYAA